MAEKRKQRTFDNRPVVALQIGHTLIRAVYFRQEDGRMVDTQFLEEQWQPGGLKIASAEGIQGMKKAFRKLVQRLPRGVDTAYVALSGEYCVTRVVSDTNENVLHEVREIESRSRLYLSLGHGEKVVAGNIYQQDPRHQHATVSVVHRKTVEVILEIAKSAGLAVVAIEPAVISLCRLMAAVGLTRESPSLLVCPGQAGVEIAIAYQGRLYLDYRPAGVTSQEEIADVLVHHLQRLHRYCRRHARVMQDSIASVYLAGQRHRSESIKQLLEDRMELPVRILETATESGQESVVPEDLPESHFPALGVGLLAIGKMATPGPNLMERLNAEEDVSIWPQVFKMVLPLAATLLIAATVWGYLLKQRWDLNQQLVQAAELEPFHREAVLMQGRMARGRELLNVQEQIDKQLPRQPLSAWMPRLGSGLPENTWLTSVALDDQGDLTVEGNALSEASVFEFAQRIRELPFVSRASIEGVLPVNTANRSSVKFTIECDLNDWVAAGDENDGSI
ncbi:PilN domain-containing protein [Blastopirellula marina]|uniref:Fimbrial assembly protein n=1 Tax=Blastopirellula marina TaxID=124 RepID=A0A2S8GDJ6_9BACT|nr:PilN domain-containing protein [Blastopirellula marina]PQO42509.1 hypothetical protein C5Y93_29740 [Blastopirellula marina]